LTPEEVAAVRATVVPQPTVEELQQKIDELQTQLNAIQAG
jgi:lipid II:glycine glycyltransferase (peptidoglycan interpeptide bridge formation enzyme)